MSISTEYRTVPTVEQEDAHICDLVKSSFAKIAPSWPLHNLIAVNPLQGFENLPIEDATKMASAYFEQPDLPQEMLLVNIETIKWLASYCDEGQATITMPMRQRGLYNAWTLLAPYDEKLHKNIKANIGFLRDLPEMPKTAISQCLLSLGIDEEEQQQFLTLLLTTLPGWASYIKYKTEWAADSNQHKTTQVEYLGVRLIITTLLWPQAKALLKWHAQAVDAHQNTILEKIQKAENSYRIPLLRKLAAQNIRTEHTPKAQLIFCIDVRSEQFRRSLEATGNYQTLGFAGFFGIPVQITDEITGLSYTSCPVLAQPKHTVIQSPSTPAGYLRAKRGYESLTSLKRLYQSLKYNFTTPFALVEALGPFSGIWMGLRTLSPKLASKIKDSFMRYIGVTEDTETSIESISFEEQCYYAESALRMMGLTYNFAPVIVFCGHGSSTQNNAYATALDCGACGGRHGGNNAKILAAILSRSEVKTYLASKGINIPEKTQFLAAEHNTTTDEVIIYSENDTEEIKTLKCHLEKARNINTVSRFKKLGLINCTAELARLNAHDWAQVRPEWGLARNAAFIVAPRDLTVSLDLDGRCFLHSYDHKQDPKGFVLTTILTAPMIVAEWINMQYLFSTVNNIAYGSGSKITKNISGKIGVMQGNASDLMNGLPLQSLYYSDTQYYHEPQRLMVVVLAPKIMVSKIIQGHSILQRLFGNGWMQMAVIEPANNKIYLLNRDFSWQEID